jgi:hypothetical protein
MDGNVTAKGQKSDVDTDFSDIWDELNIAGMVTFDARKDNWASSAMLFTPISARVDR